MTFGFGKPIEIDLPRGWYPLSLGSIRREHSDSFNPSQRPNEIFELYSVPSHETGKPEIVRGSAIGSNKQFVCPSDILISRINPRLNRTWVVGDFSAYPKIASTEWLVFPVNESIHSRFLGLILSDARVRDYLAHNASGVGGSLMRARPGLFDSITIALPPRNEQRRIVAKIEELFSELDKGVEALTTAREQLKAYRQSVLVHAFKGKFTEDSRRGKATLWRTLPVSELLGAPLCNGHSVKDRTGGFPVLRLTALKNGPIDLNESKEGAWDRNDALQYLVKSGDFLVARGNGSKQLVGIGGIVGEVRKEVAFPDTMIRLRLGPNVDHRYFAYCWNSRIVRQQIERDARTTAGIYKINQDHISKFVLPVPLMDEQKEIVRILDERLDCTDFSIRQIDAEIARANALRQSILKQAFSGQLVAQDPSDEPASVLLERIRKERETDNKKAVAKKPGRKTKNTGKRATA